MELDMQLAKVQDNCFSKKVAYGWWWWWGSGECSLLLPLIGQGNTQRKPQGGR
jgi:hypothetical protein